MASNLPAIIGAFVSDTLSLVQVPGADTAGVGVQMALERVMKRREETARQVLLEQLQKGHKTEHDAASEDEAAAILFRYLRAAQEGAARRNLRLMAQVIRGQLVGGRLIADEFLYWADVLANLRREEILLLGLFVRIERAAKTNGRAHYPPADRWQDIVKTAIAMGYLPDEEAALAVATGLGRHALVKMISYGVTSAGFSPHIYAAEGTGTLWRLAVLCDLEAGGNEN